MDDHLCRRLTGEQSQHQRDQRDDQAAEERRPEAIDGELDAGGGGDLRGEPQQQRVDDQAEQAERQYHQRAGEQREDRPEQGIDQAEEHGDYADLPAGAGERDARYERDRGKNCQRTDQPAQGDRA